MEDKFIYNLLEESAEKFPEKVALIYKNYKITYSQLNNYSNYIAQELRTSGVTSESVVGILSDFSIETIAYIYGILKAGGSYLPLSSDYPSERINHILNEAKVEILLTNSTYKNELNVLKCEIKEFKLPEGHFKNQLNNQNKNNLAYIIYTSGSTGKPKGVMVEHHNLYNHVKSFIKTCNIKSTDTFWGLYPISFDASVEVIFPILSQGGTLVLFEKDINKDIDAIVEILKNECVTIFAAPPIILKQINDNVKFCVGDTKLRLLLTGGDNLQGNYVDGLRKNVEIMNGYGVTEATVSSTWYTLPKEEEKILIGKPMSGCYIYILNESLDMVKDGEAGEIYIGGEGISRGYINDEQKTKLSFIVDKFNSDSNVKIYKTGDLGRILPDGNIEFLGRKDSQLSVRGFRVEAEEVQTIIQNYEGVIDSFVTMDSEKNKLMAYIELVEPEIKLDLKIFRKFLKEYLPEYMIPNTFVIVNNIPRNSSGKIDKENISKFIEYRLISEEKFERASTVTEELLVKLWSEILALKEKKISIDSNFYELGGDSLKLSVLITKLREAKIQNINVRDIIKFQTIREQGALIDTKQGEKSYTSNSIVPTHCDTKKYPLSSTQLRIWLLCDIGNDKSAYNTISAIKITGKLDENKFINLFNSLIKKHKLFTVRFINGEDNQIWQELREDLSFNVNYIDLYGYNEYYRNSKLNEIIEYENNYVFNLENDLLIRAYLLKMGNEEYVFVCNVHHIIVDNISWKLLMNEFKEIYEGKSHRSENISYFDYILWEKNRGSTKELESQRKNWMDLLSGELTVLKLPSIDNKVNDKGGYIKLKFNKEITDKLKDICKRENISMYVFLLSVLKTLLYRYTSQEDIIVGSPIANRTAIGSENIIGPILNVIVSRNTITGDMKFSNLLKTIKESHIKALNNQDYLFERIIDDLKISRQSGHSPIFQVLFDYHGDDSEALVLSDLKIENIEIKSKHSKYELTVTGAENHKKLIINFEYDSQKFNRKIMESFVEGFEFVIKDICNDYEKEISKLEIMGDERKNYILYDLNRSEKDYPIYKNIGDLFEEILEDNYNKIAYEYENETLSYGDLNVYSNKVGHHLRKLGVCSNSIVGVCLDKSLMVPKILLGIIKSSGAYLPLDPNFPVNRINFMFDKSDSKLLITEKKYLDIFKNTHAKIICTEDLELQIEDESAERPINMSKPQDIFNVIYTSASTGEPKGVILTNQSIANRIYWMWDKYPFKDFEIMSSHKSFVLVGSFWEIFGGLLKGIKTRILSRETVINSELLWNKIKRDRITRFFASPPIITGLIKEGEVRNEINNTLLLGATSAEPVTPELVRRWKKVFVNAPLLNLYGSTEDCSDVSVFNTLDFEEECKHVPVGKVIDNTKIYILDDYLQPVPYGVVGEICISGLPLAKEYLNNKELTDKKFISNPYGQGIYNRLFKTGDYGYYNFSGNIQIIGRKDNQIKFNGHRIEVEEIELILKQYPGIRNAAIKMHKIEDTKKIIAYIVGDSDYQLDHEKLRQYMKALVPEYMIPGIFMKIDKMPTTPNGKINRFMLPVPKGFRPELKNEYVKPRTPIEEVLADIFKDILKINDVGVKDDFFSLGGDSLMAIQLLGRIRYFFNVNVPIVYLFDNSDVYTLSRFIVAHQNGENEEIRPIKKNSALDKYPLSFMQEGMWFYHQLEPRNVFYNVSSNKIVGDFNIEIFKKALNLVVKKHDSLRMVFKYDGKAPYLQVKEEENIDISIVDLSHIKADKKEVEMKIHARAFISKPYNLEEDSMVRAIIYKLGKKEYVSLISIHHIVSDGWSIDILMKEISLIYNDLLNNCFSPTELDINYTDYILWQKDIANKNHIDINRNYWKRILEGQLPILNIPADRKRPSLFTYKGNVYEFEISSDEYKQIDSLAKKHNCTLFMILLAAYKVLLYRYTGVKDLIIGTPVAGRDMIEVEKNIGYFVNTLALRTRINSEMAFSEYLKVVRSISIDAFAHGDYPFDSVVKDINPKRDLSRTPIFQSMFNLMDRRNKTFELPSVDISDAGIVNDLAPYDLTMIVWSDDEKLSFYIEYYPEIFEELTIKRMMEHYKNILTNVINNSETCIDEIAIMSQLECKEILNNWSNNFIKKVDNEVIFNEYNKITGDEAEILTMYVLDKYFRPLPNGVEGDIYLVKVNKDKLNEGTELQGNIDLMKYDLIKTELRGYHRDAKIILRKDELAIEFIEGIECVTSEEDIKTQSIIHSIWEDIIGASDIGNEINFFDAGGHSLMIVEIINKINNKFNTKLQVIDFFKNPTISALAKVIKNNNVKNAEPKVLEDRAGKQRQALNRLANMRKK